MKKIFRLMGILIVMKMISVPVFAGEVQEVKEIETTFSLNNINSSKLKSSETKIIPLKAVGDAAFDAIYFVQGLDDPFYVDMYIKSVSQSSPAIKNLVLNADGSITVTFDLKTSETDVFDTNFIAGKNFYGYYEIVLESEGDVDAALKETSDFYYSVFQQELPVERLEELTNVYTIPLAIWNNEEYSLISIPYIG